jgi:single-strand DNA-binding protein
MNQISLIGRLTKASELKYTQAGVAVASFTLAVDRQFKNKNGEKEADFINCVAWKHTAEAIANFTDKGHRIGITGRIQTRNYENNEGKRIFVTEVVAEQVTFLEPKQQKDAPRYNADPSNPIKKDSDPFQGGQPIDEDSLPF